MLGLRACLAVATWLFLLPVLNGQTTHTELPSFTSSTQLVLIPTLVNDRSGEYMSGLTKNDFALKQDGKSLPIAIFEEVKTSSARFRRSAGEKGIYSNVEIGGGRDLHRLNIIVLDFVNTPFPDQANARVALLKFLSEVAESGEPMCLLALTRNGLKLIHDFTDDPKILAEGLRKAENSTAPLSHESEVDTGHPIGGSLAAALTALIRGQLEAESQLASLENRMAASLTVQAMQQIAKAFGGLPGRKALIWASSGFPFSLSPPSMLMCNPACPVHQGDEMQSAYDNLWRLMNDAQIAIYTVDLRSTASGTSASGEDTFTHPYDNGDPEFDVAAQAQWKRQDTDSTLQMFAQNTGGKAFLGGGNLIQSFRQATSDDSSYYLLGYYITRSTVKPGWHHVSVTIGRKGAHARYRNGFFVIKDQAPISARQEIQLALRAPLDFVGIPISVAWSGNDVAKVPGKIKATFDLVMPPDFTSVDESDENHIVVDIAAVARNQNGDVVTEFSQRVDSHLKSDGLEQIQRHGMTYRNSLQLPPGRYIIRFVVRDSLGNRIGSVVAPLTLAPQVSNTSK
jgi:VWFA-related protein